MVIQAVPDHGCGMGLSAPLPARSRWLSVILLQLALSERPIDRLDVGYQKILTMAHPHWDRAVFAPGDEDTQRRR